MIPYQNIASPTDAVYRRLLLQISARPVRQSRNGPVKSHHELPQVLFHATPLVTLRKTAWRMALREWEWFMSGDSKCPDELLPWWEHQLNPSGQYVAGYGEQLRGMRYGHPFHFDQIAPFLDGIRRHPESRRLVLTTWNPADMSRITLLNENPNTPTTCHTSFLQAFVRDGALYFTSYQRSADMLLGVPHNWIQTWGFLLYCARHTGLALGGLRWLFGDAHVYQHSSHTNVLQQFLDVSPDHPRLNGTAQCPALAYTATRSDESVPPFRAADFEMYGILEPLITDRPVLL
jgi:thymidylate synthase